MVPFCEGVGKGSNLVKKRKIMEKFFSVSRKVLGGLFVFLAIASIVSGAVYSTGALVVKLLIAELLYAGLCFLFLFLAERTWDSCDSFVERLGMGALSVGVFGVVVGFPAYLFGADLWTGIGRFACRSRFGTGTCHHCGAHDKPRYLRIKRSNGIQEDALASRYFFTAMPV